MDSSGVGERFAFGRDHEILGKTKSDVHASVKTSWRARNRSPAAFALLLAILSNFASASASLAFPDGTSEVPGEILVKLHAGPFAARSRSTLLTLGLMPVRAIWHNSSAQLDVYRVTVPSSDLAALTARLRRLPGVVYAQPNYTARLYPPTSPAVPIGKVKGIGSDDIGRVLLSGNLTALAGSFFAQLDLSTRLSTASAKPPLRPRPAEVLPAIADPDLNLSYGLKITHALEAWNESRGSQDVVVAVIDSGVDYNHEDLAFNLWRNPAPSAEMDIVGYDFLAHDGLPYDDDNLYGHGTHASGIIGAVGSNGKGISGVNQRVSIMALKGFSAYQFSTTDILVAAINYAVDHGAKIISNSWENAKKDNPAMIEAIERARDKGVLFVVAAGNSANDDDNDATAEYPAGYSIDNIVAVASSDSEDQLASSSNYGKNTVLLAAPGVNIYSTLPGAQMYGWESGTSMACPLVAGAAALVWAKNPNWNYLQVRKALRDSVDVLPQFAGKVASGGRLNVARLLQQAP